MSSTKSSLTLYFSPVSGHSHRARLMLGVLGLDHTLVELDLGKNEQKSSAFLKLNRWGEVPVLIDGQVVVPDSTAILVYLGRRYDESGQWVPSEPTAAAEVQRWLSIASGELLRGPVLARAALALGKDYNLECAQKLGRRLLCFVDSHLSERKWLAGSTPTIADVAHYSYLAVVEEGGLSLDPHPAVRAWLRSVEGLSGFVPMPRQS